jgi:23S rRNA pseudouridine1911/1915/1917 synthase
MNLSIVYEDENLLVINKPSGLAVHKINANDPRMTLADILVQKYPNIKDVGEDPLRPGIVHRLDKETSGLMIVAKNNQTFFYLKKLFQERKIKKTYIALISGHPKSSHGVIDVPLAKIGTKQTTQIKGRHKLIERQAETGYKTIRNFKDYSLLEVTPKTGRTHQIRIHLKSIGHPIVGDKIYGSKSPDYPPNLSRLFLHAQKLEFTTPDGKALALETDLPEDLQKVVSALE